MVGNGGAENRVSGLAVDLASCASACLSACLRWSWLVAWKSNKKPEQRPTNDDDGLSLGRPERGDLRRTKQVSGNTRGRTSCCYFVLSCPGLYFVCKGFVSVWLCERRSAEHEKFHVMTPPRIVLAARQQQVYLASMHLVQALKALCVSLSHLIPSSPTTLCLSNNRIRRLPRRRPPPPHTIIMKTALVLVAAAATLSCTLAFVPPAPVVSRQRSAVRYVHMCGGGRGWWE